MKKGKIQYAEDDTQTVGQLFRLRLMPLVVGLILGVGLSFLVSRFEQVLDKNVSLVFFIPFVVYLSDAIGTQTQSIYTRNLRTSKVDFKKYLVKETMLGLLYGIFFAVIIFAVAMLWLGLYELALTVGLAVFGAVSTAPLIALITTEILQLEHEDPAIGAGPIATVVQDAVSVLIYGLIASAIML